MSPQIPLRFRRPPEGGRRGEGSLVPAACARCPKERVGVSFRGVGWPLLDQGDAPGSCPVELWGEESNR